MDKRIVAISIVILVFMGVLKINNLSKENQQYKNLTVKYFLGMTFPQYNHPAKLYDEVRIQNLDKKSTAYYIGYFESDKLIKFEKYFNNEKIMDFDYLYDTNGNLIKYTQNLPKK